MDDDVSASNEEWFQSVDDDDDDCRSESGGEDEEDDNGEDLLADILAQDAFETTSTSTLASNAGAGKRTESTDRTLAGQLALNPTKAGLAGVDRQLVNSKILEASRGSRFFVKAEKKNVELEGRVAELREKVARLTPAQIARAEKEADVEAGRLESERDLSRTIVHLDMDAFYASVEERDDPSLRLIPIAVGGMSMLSTANYEARKFGVRSAMPGYIGLKLCPHLKIVPLRFGAYKEASEVVRRVLAEYNEEFVPMSLDEAYLDLTPYLETYPDITAAQAVEEMRAKIRERTRGLTASAGIAPNMQLAKICCEVNKPNGQYQLKASREAVVDFVRALPIRKVFGIGRVSERVLNALGVNSVQDLWDQRAMLRLLFSAISATSYLRSSLGIGSVHAKRDTDALPKSISTERTFRELSAPNELREKCRVICSKLAEDMARRQVRGRSLTLKLKTVTFDVRTRARVLVRATANAEEMYATAVDLLNGELESVRVHCSTGGGVLRLRLMGVRMAQLERLNESQPQGGEGVHERFGSGGGSSLSAQQTIESLLTEQEQRRAQAAVSHECPSCQRTIACVSHAAFEQHLDECLNRKAINAIVQADAAASVSKHSGRQVDASKTVVKGKGKRATTSSTNAAKAAKKARSSTSTTTSTPTLTLDAFIVRHSQAGFQK